MCVVVVLRRFAGRREQLSENRWIENRIEGEMGQAVEAFLGVQLY